MIQEVFPNNFPCVYKQMCSVENTYMSTEGFASFPTDTYTKRYKSDEQYGPFGSLVIESEKLFSSVYFFFYFF